MSPLNHRWQKKTYKVAHPVPPKTMSPSQFPHSEKFTSTLSTDSITTPRIMHWYFFHAPLVLAALGSARSLSMYSQHESRYPCIVPRLIVPIFYPIAIDVTSDQVELHGSGSHTTATCKWAGTAPFCAGQCDTRAGWVACSKSKYGDGHTCTTGWKIHCCRDGCPPNADAGTLPVCCQCCLDISSAPPASRLS